MFSTVCSKDRRPWLACDEVHETLVDVWRAAIGWLVGRYVVMPDHLHLFAAPGDMDIEFDAWTRYWKSMFTKRHGVAGHRWQSGHWDTRLRSSERYEEKWFYVRDNPVRHRLVDVAERWRFQGEVWELVW